ncbi:MAG: YfhO family protein, partial [Actinobacteria bacterium]|nr:YfhO family protein [Actinomycetota bacterium]
MKKIFKKIWPLLFIFLIWIIFTGPYFINNKTTFPSNYQVNSVPPWRYYDKFWGPVKNGAMPDIIGQLYPWRHFSVNALKAGEIPFWNPYSFSGNPHLANYQSAVFSPLNLLFFILPFIDAWTIIVLLQPLLAGIFMYFLVKELKVSEIGSLISSVTFMFCGFLVVWMAYGTLSMAIAFLPLGLFGIEKFYNTNRIRYLFFLSLSIFLPVI